MVFLALTSAKGQYVFIPDSNFRHALINQGFASCFDISQTMLDTTCYAVLDSTLINVANKNIRSIEGIQYFKQMHSFACDSNPLYILPTLPNTTSYLSCQFDSLTSLPQLPTSLYYLSCFNNQIDSLPALPNGLRWLYIQNNAIQSLPPIPATVYGFYCQSNLLHSFPLLPFILHSFDCSYNPITIFPLLPDSLAYLYCQNDSLTALPALPVTLKELNCSNNLLSSLPLLPDSLTGLNCSRNQLTSLPNLPDSMENLSCGYNPQLTCLPELKRILNLNFDSTGVVCVPDTTGNITYSSPPINSFPLCVGNGCTTTGIREQTISGLRIYPNPVNDILYVDYPVHDLAFTICDMTGRIFTSPMTDNGIDVSSLSSGLYYLQLQNKYGLTVKKFVKE